jgi:hypothetical protein
MIRLPVKTSRKGKVAQVGSTRIENGLVDPCAGKSYFVQPKGKE